MRDVALLASVNVTAPGALAFVAESANLNSVAVTFTAVPWACRACDGAASTGPATANAAKTTAIPAPM